MKCDFCRKDAVMFIRYSGRHLCRDHFIRFVERRVKEELRRQADIRRGTIAVGISGGKDSAVALYLLHRIFRKNRDLEVVAITVDEGIAGYRDEALRYAKHLTEMLGVEHIVVSFSELYGLTLDEIAPHTEPHTPCSYCGVLRRKALNVAAKRINAAFLATGLNLDDTAQTILMNITRGDVERLARMGPHIRVKEGFIPRLQPLRRIPEKEVMLYAMLRGIPFHAGTCPYAASAVRNIYREILFKLEEDTPGTRHAVLNTYEEIRRALADRYAEVKLGKCSECGEPCVGHICKACEMLDRIRRRLTDAD